jgi:hypothetical protein
MLAMVEMIERSVVVELQHAIGCCGSEIQNCALLLATPCGPVVVIDVSEEPNETMTVLTGLPCPHRTPFIRDALKQPCCSCYISSRYAIRPVLLFLCRHPVLTHTGQHHDILYCCLSPLATHKKHNFILGNWPHPCNNRQKLCVYLSLSTSSVQS